MLDCLNGIVGVLKDATPVIVSGLNSAEIAELQVSKSGLFLDELPGGVHMKALKFIDSLKTFSQMALGALELARKNLEADLIVALREKYDKSRNNFQGTIGQMSYATTLQINKRYQYVRIRPLEYVDGIVTINRFNAIFNKSGVVNISLLRVPLDSVAGEEIKSFPLTVAANQFKTVEFLGDDILNLPLVFGGQPVEYWWVYDTLELGAGGAPKDMKLSCQSCGNRTAANDFITVSGGELDDLTNLNYKTTDNYAHGLVLDVAITCNTGGIFCKEYNNQEAVGVTMAYGVWYKAGELLIEEVLKSPDVNRYTTMAREYLWGKRNHFRSEYESRVRYLAAVIDVQASNCYVCREIANQPTKGMILI